ncbi:unnamed protein product [Phytomonas sp. EM1]|nr:unnamed protein product [Phytomonas sp. EM1]|eukprot:CCW61259.1 unnamed protein product [Phytomonas sp. isolate EM1]
MNLQENSAEDKRGYNGRVVSEGQPPPISPDVPQHLRKESPVPAGQSFPQSVAFLWQVLNDMGLVETAKTLRGELNETGFSKDMLLSPSTPIGDNSRTVGLENLGTTVEMDTTVDDQEIKVEKRRENFLLPQDLPSSLSADSETEANCTNNSCKHHHPTASTSTSNFSFHSLLEKVLREKLGNDGRKTMNIVQVLSYYTVEPLTGALSSLQHVRKGSSGTGDDVMNSIGQVDHVINALSALYDDLTAVALAQNDVSGLDCEDCEANSFPLSLQPSVLKRVFIQYCNILLLQQNLTENMIISDIISQWTTCSEGLLQRESSSQPSDKASAHDESTLCKKNGDEAREAERDPHKASSNDQHTTTSNRKPKSRKKRRSSLSTKSTTLEEEVYDDKKNNFHDGSAPASSLNSNEEENKHTTKDQQACFHVSNSPPYTVQSLLQRNAFQCACHLLSCTHSLHMTLSAHHAHRLRTQAKDVPEGNQYSSDGQDGDKVGLASSPPHETPAIELVEQALELMNAANGMWKRRAELVLRRVLQRSWLCCSAAATAVPVSLHSPHGPGVSNDRVESGKGLPVSDKKTTTRQVSGWQDVSSSIQAVVDACHVPVFQRNNELDAVMSSKRSEIYVGLEALFLPRCPSCDKKQEDPAMSKANNENMTEEEENRSDREKISFVRIWNVADRARNILWMLQSAEEHVRLMHLPMKSAHSRGQRNKALEDAISVWEGQWAAHCASVLKQTLLVQSDHGGATANIKDVNEDRKEGVKTNSCFMAFGHLEYRRHRYERLFTSYFPSLSAAVGEKVATQGISGSLPEADFIADEDFIHNYGGAACRCMPYSSPLGESRRRDMMNKDIDRKTLWDVFLDGVCALTDGFCLAAAQLLQEGTTIGTDIAPQGVEKYTYTRSEEVSTLADTVAGRGGGSDDSLLARVQQEKRSCVYARLFSSFVPFSRMSKVGLLRSEHNHPLELSTMQGCPSCSEGWTPSSLLFEEKGNDSEVFPYAVDLSLACETTSHQSHGVNCKEESKHGQPYRDDSPDEWATGQSAVMGRALRAVMCSLRRGHLVNGMHWSRRVRPLRHRLRRALAHQHIVLNAQFSELPLRMQIRALQNPGVLESAKATLSENTLGLGVIAESLPNEGVASDATPTQITSKHETTADMPDILKISEADNGNLSVSGEATLLPTLATTATTGTDVGVLSAQGQALSDAHLSNVSQGQDEEASVYHGPRNQQNESQSSRFTSPTFAAIRRIAQDISITVERAIMTSDVMSWRIEGRTAPSVSTSSSSPNTAQNQVDERREGLSLPLPREQTPLHHVDDAVTNNLTTAEEEDSAASDASSSDNHFNRVGDEIAEEVQQITVTRCGTLVAFVTTCARLVVYALRAHAKESAYKEELLVDTVLPGTPKRPHWYEAHSAIVQFSPDGRFVLAAVQFMPGGVAEGEEEGESRVIPASTGQICIYSLHKERNGVATSSTTTIQQGFISASRKPLRRLFQLPNRLYATWKIHSAPITTAHWADPRFWGGGWTSPQHVFLDLKLSDQSARDSINQESSVSGSQNSTRNASDGPGTYCELLRASSAAWYIAAQARLAFFQCFSTALDNLIIRWLPCSGMLIQRISTMPVQDLVISPLMTALYTIDDKGLLSMYDAWNEGEGHEAEDLGNSSSMPVPNINAPCTILIGNRGLPASAASLQTPKERTNLSSRRQVKVVADQEVPRAFFYGTHIIRFDRSDITARHYINPGYLANTNSNSIPPVLVAGRSGDKARKSGAGAMNYLSRFLRLSVMGESSSERSAEAGNDEEVSLFSQGMTFHRSVQMGRRLIQRVLAEQVSGPPPNSVFLSPSSIPTSQRNTDIESIDEEEEYGHVGVPELSSGGLPYPYSQCVENEKGTEDGPSLHRGPQASPSHRRREISDIPNAFYKSGSRLVFSEIGRALRLSGNIAPTRHNPQIDNDGVPYHLLSLALSGQPQWGSLQHNSKHCIESEETTYRTLIRLWRSRKLRDVNLPQTTGKSHDPQEGCEADSKGGNSNSVIDIDKVLSISYFTDDHNRGDEAQDDTPLSPSKRYHAHDNSKMRGESDYESERSLEFATRSVLSPKLHLEPSARNGRYLAIMTSIGPHRVLIDRTRPLEHRPGLYGCLIFDTYMSYVLRVVAVCPVQPVTSLTLNGTIPKHSDTKKAPVFSLQCSLTVINQKRVESREYDALGMHTHCWYRKNDPNKPVARNPKQILASQGTGAEGEKVILTVGGLHNILYVFDALSGDRIRTVTLRESDFARMIQASRARAMRGVTAQDSCGEERNRDSTFLPSQHTDINNCDNRNRGSTVTMKQERTGGFRYMRGANSKASIEDVLYSLSTWDRFEGPDTTAYFTFDKAESNTERERHTENATAVTNYEGFDKMWSQMANLSEDDQIGSTSEDEDEIEGKDSNEEVTKGKGRLRMRNNGAQHRRHRSRRRLVDQLVQRYGLPLVLYAQKCLMSVIDWPSEMRGHLLNGSHGIAVHSQNRLGNISQSEDRATCSKTPRQNPDSQALLSPIRGMTEGRILLTTMADLSRRLLMNKVSQKCTNPLFLSGHMDHSGKSCYTMFRARTACFDEPFKLAVEQLMELSHVMHINACGGKLNNRNATSSLLAEMMSEICRNNAACEEPPLQNRSTSNCDTQGNSQQHLHYIIDTNSNVRDPAHIFEENIYNVHSGNSNRKLLHCGVVNTVATWCTEEHCGMESKRSAFHMLAGTESGQLHIVGGLL